MIVYLIVVSISLMYFLLTSPNINIWKYDDFKNDNTSVPTLRAGSAKLVAPTTSPTIAPTTSSTIAPTISSTIAPTISPTNSQLITPTIAPIISPTIAPPPKKKNYTQLYIEIAVLVVGLIIVIGGLVWYNNKLNNG